MLRPTRQLLNKATLFLLLMVGVQGFVPEECVRNVTGGSKTCCPIPSGFDEPCGGRGRGVCDTLSVHREMSVEHVFTRDDRVNWPLRFFNRMCRCEGNYYGVGCETCWHGWTGIKCDQHRRVTRRNIFSLTKIEQQRFIEIVSISNTVPSPFMILFEDSSRHSDPLREPLFIHATFQQFIAFIHRYTSRSTLFESRHMCHYYGYLDNNHNTVAFATWHRALMLLWERQLAEIAERRFGWKDFAIPYWDWVDAKECEPCTNDLVGATGKYDEKNLLWRLDEKSSFYNWTEYCSPPNTNNRCVGCHFASSFPPLNRKYLANDFPTTEDLTFTLRHSNWYLSDEKLNQMKSCRSFHLALEGFCGRPEDNSDYLFMHNRVHNMVKGSMCCAATASNDPLFILHHSTIDRILECWFNLFSPTATQLPNHGVEIGNCRECNIIGHIPAVRHAQMFQKMTEFGIKYDNLRFGKQGFDCVRDAQTILNTKID